MNTVVRLSGLLFCALAAACSMSPQQKAAPPATSTYAGPLTIDPSLAGRKTDSSSVADPRSAAPAANTVLAVEPAPSVAAAPGTASIAEAAAAVTAAGSTGGSATPAPPPAKVTAKVVATPAIAEKPAAKIETPAVVVKKPEPTLDMTALTARLRDTKSIGVFTKLALKGQVDDLLKQFRSHYQGGKDSSVAALRQPYDMLVLKVLAVVQDNDPSLAREIAGSREAIWGVLADPKKFNAML